jgi:hypothetical protein
MAKSKSHSGLLVQLSILPGDKSHPAERVEGEENNFHPSIFRENQDNFIAHASQKL